MLLRRRINLYGRLIVVLTLFILGSSACGDDVATVTESASGTTGSTLGSSSSGTAVPTTSGTGEETSSTGNEVCELMQRTCSQAADCCEGGAFGGCPGTNYPHNWSCVGGFCEHGGCDAGSNSDCTNLLPGFECHVVDNIGQCVAPCDSHSDCAETFILSDLQCTGVSSKGNFCQ